MTFGLIREIGRAVDHAEDFHDPLHAIETAERRLRRRQDLQPNLARRGVPFLDRHRAAELCRAGFRCPDPCRR